MANSINATSTGNGGIITTGDDSGVLNIQTNETTAMSVDASQSVDFVNNIDAPNTFGFKNRIINGGMTIDQRNAGASVTPTDGSYTLDRYLFRVSQASKLTCQQSSTAPVGFKNSLLVTSSSAYSVGSGDFFAIEQRIEGYNVSDLGFGTANAATVTLSFWVRSSLTGTFGGAFANGAFDRCYPFTYTISAANTWEQKTVTIVGDTSGTWATNSSTGFKVQFGLGVGSTYSASAGSWQTTTAWSATGATSVVGTNGATWYVTGVQLEKGTQATSFDFRSYGTELALCQRYLPAYSSVNNTLGSGSFASGTVGFVTVTFPVLTRVAPTGLTASSGSALSMYANGNYASSAISLEQAGINGAMVRVTVSGAPTGYASVVYLTGSSPQILFTGCEL